MLLPHRRLHHTARARGRTERCTFMSGRARGARGAGAGLSGCSDRAHTICPRRGSHMTPARRHSPINSNDLVFTLTFHPRGWTPHRSLWGPSAQDDPAISRETQEWRRRHNRQPFANLFIRLFCHLCDIHSCLSDTLCGFQ